MRSYMFPYDTAPVCVAYNSQTPSIFTSVSATPVNPVSSMFVLATVTTIDSLSGSDSYISIESTLPRPPSLHVPLTKF